MLSELLSQLDAAADIAAKALATVNEAQAAQAEATKRYAQAVSDAHDAHERAVAKVRSLQAQIGTEINGAIGSTEDSRVR